MSKLRVPSFLRNHPVRVTITVALLAFVTIAWVTHWIDRHRAGPPCTALAGLGAREENGRCVINELNTANYRGQRLPDNLTVRGDVQIYGQRLDMLPKGLLVEGELFFYKATYAIPEDLVVRGNVDSSLGFGDELLKCAEIPKTAKLMGSVRCE
jgi:hypothetical protein